MILCKKGKRVMARFGNFNPSKVLFIPCGVGKQLHYDGKATGVKQWDSDKTRWSNLGGEEIIEYRTHDAEFVLKDLKWINWFNYLFSPVQCTGVFFFVKKYFFL